MGIEKLTIGSGETEFTIEVEGEKFLFAKRELSWSHINSILSGCLEVGTAGGIKMDVGKYNTECLVAMLTKVPWDAGQTRIVLAQLKPEVGKMLEAHVPSFESVVSGGADENFFGGK